MEITILGTRGEIDLTGPYHSRHSGMLIDGKFLFDLGEAEFLSYKPSQIFITHLHPDHAFFVRSRQKFPATNATMYAPETGGFKEIHELSKTIRIGAYHITPIPTEHSLKVKSQAYLIEKGGKRILYTGDLFWINKEYRHLLHNLNLVITDGSYLKAGGMVRRSKNDQKAYGHTGIPNLIHLFKEFTSTILFVHFGSWFYEAGSAQARKKLQALGKTNNVAVLVGYDGMRLTI